MSAPAESPSAAPELVIEAGRAEAHYWRDLWRYRELLGFLAWRDIKVRYKQTALGVAWALVQPIVTTGIFTLIFGKVARMEEQVAAPFSLFVLAGVLPWQLFAGALSNSSASLVGNSHLISKVYFPRLVIPLSTLAVALIDFAVVLILYVALSLWFGILPDWRWLLLPAMMGLALVVALGAGLWLTALTVKFRDFRYIVPFLLQVGLFLSPVGFRPEIAPNRMMLLALNPMTGVIDGFRWCLLPAEVPLDPTRLLLSAGIGAGLLLSGIWYFRRTERGFADVI
jgi:lipopolysaccharide transport system permease protein